MRRFGVVGKSLSHSFSPSFFAEFFKAQGLSATHSYEAFELLSLNSIRDLLDQNEILGLNVTIPYKEEVFKYVDLVDEKAMSIGAINTLVREAEGWKGYNTDIIGVHQSLDKLGVNNDIKAVIFGSGGAAKAVEFVLKEREIGYQIVSRSTSLNYEKVKSSVFEDHLLLINCTPLGMYPKIESSLPIPYNSIGNQHLVFDLIYNPPETLFLQKCKMRGANCLNGLQMLESQALASWQLWQKAFQV